MKFTPLPIKGAYVIDLEKLGDERGFFARAFCQREFEAQGLETTVAQANTSLSATKGTLRGLHYQLGEHAEAKLIRAIGGAVFDALVDLRPDSPTYLQHCTLVLSAENRSAIYVPRGCANGIQTLEEDTQLFYLAFNFFAPHAERGLRWNDPRFGIKWALEPTVISDKDKNHPDFDPAYHLTLNGPSKA
jgi:dTDP-4-dehydrorhamnose 3,5-epimerase